MPPNGLLISMAHEIRRHAKRITAEKAARFSGSEPNRDRLDREFERILKDELSTQQGEILAALGDNPQNIPPSYWQTSSARLSSRVQPVLQQVYIQRVMDLGEQLTIGLDWDLVNQHAAQWASEYTFDLVGGITNTTTDILRNSIESFYTNGLDRQALEDLIAPAFGQSRASTIAVTEITRASSQGELEVRNDLAEFDIEMQPYWATNNDELVCPVCGPLNGKKAAGNDGSEPYWVHPDSPKRYGPPPAHPNCRCWINLRIK